MEVKDKLTVKEKWAYANGTLPGVIYAAFLGQIQVFYYAWMGLGVGYILLAQIFFAKNSAFHAEKDNMPKEVFRPSWRQVNWNLNIPR